MLSVGGRPEQLRVEDRAGASADGAEGHFDLDGGGTRVAPTIDESSTVQGRETSGSCRRISATSRDRSRNRGESRRVRSELRLHPIVRDVGNTDGAEGHADRA